MPLPIIAGAVRTVVGAAGLFGGKADQKAAGKLSEDAFNAQNIVSGLSQIGGAIKSFGISLVSLPLEPIKAFTSAIELINQPILVVVDTLKGFRNAVGAVGTAVSEFVKLANPIEVLKFNLAMDDFTATIGKVLTPILTASTAVVRGFADVIFAISGPLQSIVASFFKPIERAIPGLVNSMKPLVDALEKLQPKLEELFSALGEQAVSLATDAVQQFVNTMQLLAVTMDPVITSMTLFTKSVSSIGALFRSDPGAAGGKGLSGGSVGAAVRPAQITSVEEYGRKAQQAAFSLGTAANPAKETADNTKQLLNEFKRFAAAVEKFLSFKPSDVLKSAAPETAAALTDAGRRLEDVTNPIAKGIKDFFSFRPFD